MRRILVVVALGGVLAGCAAGPDYRAPQAAVPTQWQAALPHGGDAVVLADWWARFQDPLMSELVRAAEADNPTLAVAWFRIAQARAALTTAEAAGRPQVDGKANANRSGPLGNNPNRPATSGSVAADAAWELDLFGAVQRGSEQAAAIIETRVAGWHEARVSLAAEVASTYVALRSAERLAETYRQELASLRAAVALLERKTAAGFGAQADLDLARATVAQTEATLVATEVTAAHQRTALVALTGLEAAALTKRLAVGTGVMPRPADMTVTALPAQVVSQRPDVVGAERSLAAACAAIGIAEADRYPRLSITGNLTVGSVRSDGASSATSAWSIGPVLSVPLFDGGRRVAAVASARAAYEEDYAAWRQKVVSAVQEVEDALLDLDAEARREQALARAADGYAASLTSTIASWQQGLTSLVDLETVRRQALVAQRDLLTVQSARVTIWIRLYKAAGGGWDGPVAPHAPVTRSALADSATPPARRDAP